MTGKDVHKNGREVAEAGGVVAVFGALLGILLHVALFVFYYQRDANVAFILAAVCSILIALVIGFVDDILGWRIGLRQRDKVVISFLIPLPMMVVNSGQSIMSIPFLGVMEIGMLYPLLFIPIAMIGAANAFNMLAGYNGLEAGSGIIILSVLGLLSWWSGSGWVAMIAFTFVAALLAFLFFNYYPAKVFPGDTLTYPVGTAVAIVAILGNLEMYAFFLMVPYFIELILKARGRFVPDWTCRVREDRSLAHRGKWYTLPHLSVSLLKMLDVKRSEKNVVLATLGLHLFMGVIALFFFW